jgi:hypothetical protein
VRHKESHRTTVLGRVQERADTSFAVRTSKADEVLQRHIAGFYTSEGLRHMCLANITGKSITEFVSL